jgi:hypothetical protein
MPGDGLTHITSKNHDKNSTNLKEVVRIKDSKLWIEREETAERF